MLKTEQTTRDAGSERHPSPDATNFLVGELSTALAHHVRNAAASISVNAELVLGLLEGEDPRRSPVERIVEETDRLERLILELLQAPAERQALLAPLDLREVVLEVASDTEVVLASPPGEGVLVLGDVSWLREALTILLSALKGNEAGAEIEATISRDSGMVSLSLGKGRRPVDARARSGVLEWGLVLVRARCLLLGQGGDVSVSREGDAVTAVVSLPALEAAS